MRLLPFRLSYFAALCLLLAFKQAHAQENLVPGFIFTQNNDTLSGSVDFRNWSKNPKKISFRQSSGGSIIAYSPTEIKGFQVSNQTYRGAVVDIEVSAINKLEETQQPNLRKDTVFLQMLIQEKKSLLYYRTTDSRDHFYIESPRGIELLIYKKYQNSEGLVAENKNYQRQLAYYLSDCNTTLEKLKTTTYTESSLTRLFQHYYNCTGTSSSFQSEKRKIRAVFGLTASGTLTSLKF
jgi:hypothetical protein